MTTAPIHIMLDLETWGKRPGCDLRSIGACVFDPLVSFSAGQIAPINDGQSVTMASTPKLFYIATDNPVRSDAWPQFADPNAVYADRKYPLTRDSETVAWWNDQSAEAQAAFADPVDLRQALERFADWLYVLTEGLRPIDNPSQIPGLINRDGSVDMIDVQAIGVIHDIPRPLYKCDVICLWSHGPAFDVAILAAAFEAVGLPVPWHYRAPRDTRTAFDMAGIIDHSAHLNTFATGTYHHALDDAICQARAVCDAYRLAVPTDPRDGEALRKRAVATLQAYDDWTNWNETAFTGWGDMIVPPEATMMRKVSGQALKLLIDDIPAIA